MSKDCNINVLANRCEELLRLIEKECDNARKKRETLSKLETPSTIDDDSMLSNFLYSDDKLKNDDLDEDECMDEASKFEEFVASYLPGYNEIDGSVVTFEEILDFLPSKENGYFYDLIQRLIFETKKEIAEWVSESKEILSELIEEDYIFYYDYIDALERKISLLKKALTYDRKQGEETKEENKLILVPTPSGNIRIIEDLQHISPEYYPAFLELIESIKDGSFCGFKPLSNGAKYGLAEVKGFKVRVLFSRLKDNYYAVIGAFVKKSDSDKFYRSNLLNRYYNFKMHEDELINNLDNDEFISENELQVQELYRILGVSDIKEYKKGGLSGNSDNI